MMVVIDRSRRTRKHRYFIFRSKDDVMITFGDLFVVIVVDGNSYVYRTVVEIEYDMDI